MTSIYTTPVRTCPRCKLVYRPDGRIYKEPEQYCPRCGFFLPDADNWKRRGEN